MLYRDMIKPKTFVDYYAKGNRRLSPGLLAFFENDTYKPRIGNALEIGFGVGQDSKFLAEKGYNVDAVDKNIQAELVAKKINYHKNINYMTEDISTFIFAKDYDLIISFLVLFYLSKNDTESLFANIMLHLAVGGYFIARLLGPEDDRKEIETMRTKAELQKIFLNDPSVKIHEIRESFEYKKTADKKMKNRHYVDLIVQKIVT